MTLTYVFDMLVHFDIHWVKSEDQGHRLKFTATCDL